MLTTIGWCALGFFIGGLAGMFSIALLTSKKDGEIADLKRANVRLIADVARASVNNVELDRRLKMAKFESAEWRKAYEQDTGWQGHMPGDAG